MKNAVESENGIFTIWLTRPFSAEQVRQAVVASKCTGVSLEAEIPSEDVNGPRPEAVDWERIVLFTQDLGVFKSVVTNFAPFLHADGSPWPEKAKPLIDADWACLTECYLGESPNATPERTDYYARMNLGWPETQPVLGIYGGKTLSDYPTRGNYRNWSVWDAGTVL